MAIMHISAVLICCLLLAVTTSQARYEPNWKSLDARPLPAWYDEAKLGIFIHWGVFSVPSFGDEWFWHHWKDGSPGVVNFMKDNYPPDFTYADFASQFTAEFYDPDQWADIIKASGAKYTVFVTKHHEGFCNWPTNVSFNWNSMDVGPRRDLVGEFAAALRRKGGVHLGLYHSLLEWFHPLYEQDKSKGFNVSTFAPAKSMPELYELVNSYKPDLLWSDGGWEAPSTYWNTTGFIAWLYNDSPVKDSVIVNDGWGNDCESRHGGYYNHHDKFNPGVVQKHKWENAMTIDSSSWGYNRKAQLSAYLNMDQIIETFVETVSCGGNMLMNIGPTHDGRIVPILEERLRQMGDWLAVNGEAIYSSKPWTHQNDTVTAKIWYTSQKSVSGEVTVYALVLDWPVDGQVKLGAPYPSPSTTVTMLGLPQQPLKWSKLSPGGMVISMPILSLPQMPCQWAWTLKITNLM